MSEESNKKDLDKAVDIESEPVVNPRMKFYADKLEDMAGKTTFENYKTLVIADSYQLDDVTLKAKKLKPNDIGALRKLTAEIPKINQEKEWDKYLINIRAQGKLLIENLTE